MRIGRSLAVLSALLLAVTAVAALQPNDPRRVEITDTGFQPSPIEVKAGEKVVWTNSTQNEHSVTSVDMTAKPGTEGKQAETPLFDSGPIKPGGTFEHLFDKAGSFEYSCRMDKGMKGTVVVRKAE